MNDKALFVEMINVCKKKTARGLLNISGDAGKGFSVVAEDVRNLAGRAKDAAKKTEDLVKQSVSLAVAQEGISKEVDGNLEKLSVAILSLDNTLNDIASASVEQASGIDQISNAVEQIDQIGQLSAANSQQTSSAVEMMTQQAMGLKTMVQKFHLNEGGQMHQQIS